MESILNSVKKMLGIMPDYTVFDEDIIMHINSVFFVLNQLGIGPSAGYSIKDDTNTWSEFISERTDIESVKSYIYLKVKLLFDPPSSSALLDAINRQIIELEWRLSISQDDLSKEGGSNALVK